MQKKAARRSMPTLLAAACALALAAACSLAFPATASAETYIAHSVGPAGEEFHYSTVGAAKAAGYAGATIFMDTDWDLGSGSLDIADSKSITIDMCGHRITSSNTDATIYINQNATVTLVSTADSTEFSFKGYGRTGRSGDFTVSSGGLIANTDGGGAGRASTVHLESDSHLNLENVAVVGGGYSGIYTGFDCSVDLLRATVCHNGMAKEDFDLEGGGVHLAGDSTLTMAESHVDDNYSNCFGGGVWVGFRSSVLMEKDSTISRNWALSAGGGIYVDKDAYLIRSSDGTGIVSENGTYDSGVIAHKERRSGGGIHVKEANGNDVKGAIEGLIIKDNYSAYDGGGLELDQRNTTVRDCVITGNCSARDGGGAFVFDKGITFVGCTITGNYCDAGDGAYEGGGIFVSYHYDVYMSGKNIIKGNTRGKDTGNADDVFLSTVSGGSGKAYIKGSLDSGSSVGVRTGIEGERRVAANFNYASKDCLFYDMDGYYISYGTDEGGDAWQRHTTKEFSVKVNGKEIGRYRNGTSVTVSAPTSQNGADFCYWSVNGSTGLYPTSDYINDKTMHNAVLSFKMPQNDVDLGAVYANDVASATITCSAPVADMALPTGATLAFSDGSAGTTKVPASVSWYEVGANGEKTPAFGNAKKNTAYVANFSVARSPELVCIFSGDIKDSDVTVKFTMLDESTTEGSDTSASVSETSGSLLVWSTAPKTGNSAFEAFIKNLDLVLKNQGLLGSSEAAVALTADEAASDGDVIDTIEVGCAYNEETEEVAITAPYVEGFNFCDWGDDELSDEQTVTMSVEQLKGIDSLDVYYTPMATKLEVTLDAPVAGKELDTTCDEIEVTAYDSSTVGLAEALGVDGFEVTWSPEPEDGVAGYSTTYTAVVKICAGEGTEGLETVLAQNAEVTCNGVKATSAGFFVDADGDLCLALALPPTAAVKATGISQPGDVELTFEEAAGYAADQAACPDTLCWPLPKVVDVTLENGETADGDVTWEIPAGFDANATTAQEIPVHGTVSIAYSDDVDASEVSLDVTATIKVAAPSQGGGDTPAVNPGGDNGKGADGAAAFAKTNDPVSALAMAAVAAAAIAAMATAAAAALRRRKG